jgi:N-acetylmuramoyl-L-alanine amidase
MRKASSIFVRSSGLALLAGLAVPAAGGDLAVTAVRHWSQGDVTRVAIETTGEFRYLSDRLNGPVRIFFDFPGARSLVSRKIMHVIPVGDGLLKQIRVAENSPGVTRVVLDIEHAGVEHTASQLSNPYRLMIELRARTPHPADQPTTDIEPVRPPEKKFEPPPSRPVPSVTAAANIPAPPAIRSAPRPVEPSVNRELAAVPPPPAASKEVPVAKETKQPIAAPVEAARVAAPARRPSTGVSSLTRALGLKVGRILLDAGHGGHDTGSIGPSGLVEKDLVLDVTRRLGELIQKDLGAEVFYTRTDDTFISLESRADMANEKKADLFLSIHANSSPLKAVSGAEAYYLSITTSRAALEVAARENAGSQRSVHELEELVQKIALKEKVDESKEFALKVQTAMSALNVKTSIRPRERGIKKAPFVVLIGASMPSVLVEIGFLSNSREEALLKQPEHRQRIAEALYKGLSQYAMTLSHFQVARTSAP